MSSGPTLLLTTSILTADAFTLAGCADDSPPVDDLEVIEVEELDLPEGDAFLSPDGERIATYASAELCVYNAEGEEQTCVDDELVLDAASIRWSPDGSRLVYTENYYDFFHDPDVWVVEAESGEPTNLTDDGVAEDELRLDEAAEEDEPDLDGSPTWIDDDTIRFLRWDRAAEEVAVMDVAADGGDPEQVGGLASETPPTSIAYADEAEPPTVASRSGTWSSPAWTVRMSR
ncbi:MAG: TolB family protein [Nocardioidaceae bacterium]